MQLVLVLLTEPGCDELEYGASPPSSGELVGRLVLTLGCRLKFNVKKLLLIILSVIFVMCLIQARAQALMVFTSDSFSRKFCNLAVRDCVGLFHVCFVAHNCAKLRCTKL